MPVYFLGSNVASHAWMASQTLLVAAIITPLLLLLKLLAGPVQFFVLPYSAYRSMARERDAAGRPRKREFGPWMLVAMRALRHGKRLRGTRFDDVLDGGLGNDVYTGDLGLDVFFDASPANEIDTIEDLRAQIEAAVVAFAESEGWAASLGNQDFYDWSGLSPATEGQVIRLRIPELNQERRKELVKVAHKYAEAARVAVRHVRRDGRSVRNTVVVPIFVQAHRYAGYGRFAPVLLAVAVVAWRRDWLAA